MTTIRIGRFTATGPDRITLAYGLFPNFNMDRVDVAMDRPSLFYSGDRGVFLADAEHFACATPPDACAAEAPPPHQIRLCWE